FQELEARNRELTEVLEQQTATSEILRVISNSPTDLQPVFDAIVQSATRLCDAAFGHIYRFDGELITIPAHHGLTPEELDVALRAYPRPATRGSAAGRTIVDRRVVHIHDIRSDPDYSVTAAQSSLDHRTVLAVPMLRDGQPTGALTMWRRRVEPFSD